MSKAQKVRFYPVCVCIKQRELGKHKLKLADLELRATRPGSFIHLCYRQAWVNLYGCDPRRPDGLSTVTVDEKERFEDIKERLRVILENNIVNFR